MLEVKVTSVGNSIGIILNKEILSHLKVRKGDRLFLTETPEGYRLSPYDAKFLKQMKLAQKVMKEDRDVLRALAKA